MIKHHKKKKEKKEEKSSLAAKMFRTTFTSMQQLQLKSQLNLPSINFRWTTPTGVLKNSKQQIWIYYPACATPILLIVTYQQHICQQEIPHLMMERYRQQDQVNFSGMQKCMKVNSSQHLGGIQHLNSGVEVGKLSAGYQAQIQRPGGNVPVRGGTEEMCQ